MQAVVARANSLKNSGVPDDIFQLDDLSVLVQKTLMHSFHLLLLAYISVSYGGGITFVCQ